VALMLVVLGTFIVAGNRIHEQWHALDVRTTTEDRLQQIDQALQAYFTEHGRYPCVAPLDAPLDSAGFGFEVSNDCTLADNSGTFRAAGRGGRTVRTGAVPVRTLGLPDEYIADGWGHRYTYAITEVYAKEGSPVTNSDMGAITINDAGGNNASSEVGNLAYLLLTKGMDDRGAYDLNGSLLLACDTASKAGVNCSGGSSFKNTVARSYTNDQNQFTHKALYRSVSLPNPCQEKITTSGARPKDVAYLVDTSGSMAEDGGCPPSLGAACSRIDVARWAMRKVIPSRLEQNKQEKDEDHGDTLLTGFVLHGAAPTVENTYLALGNPKIENLNDAETVIDQMCPNGNTPLGVHLEALADKLGDGTEKRPNAIMVVSDGLSNAGKDPVQAAKDIHAKYPHLQITILDVVGNPSLSSVAEITGGKYYLSTNGDKLLDDLFKAVGLCNEIPPPAQLPDKQGCGSSGDWWKK